MAVLNNSSSTGCGPVLPVQLPTGQLWGVSPLQEGGNYSFQAPPPGLHEHAALHSWQPLDVPAKLPALSLCHPGLLIIHHQSPFFFVVKTINSAVLQTYNQSKYVNCLQKAPLSWHFKKPTGGSSNMYVANALVLLVLPKQVIEMGRTQTLVTGYASFK